MAIDLKALLEASRGDQSKKVTVTKRWLRAVHDELKAAQDRPQYSADNPLFDQIFGKER
jgi:hypothetical protein